MCMYAPLLWRQVYLVCFDPRHRIALLSPQPPHACQWTLPGVRRREHESYPAAARRLLDSLAPPGTLTLAGLEGRVQASAPPRGGRARRREVRVFLTRATDPSALTAPACEGELCWVPYRQAARAVADLAIPELEDFLDGYVGGWIPDGWITLGGLD
ncbi:NUDIX domain-containing protein [Streptomyces ehimensis]|uniref:NUDIX domain-containing protein n=1 Tax=Streptomyces ehimensis TaxID=68195 RepID=A0ABV9BTD5_9ACTN